MVDFVEGVGVVEVDGVGVGFGVVLFVLLVAESADGDVEGGVGECYLNAVAPEFVGAGGS